MQYSGVANLWLNTLSNIVSGGLFTIKSDSKFTLSNSKTTMDIYAKVKYNKPEELFGVVNGAFHQAPAE